MALQFTAKLENNYELIKEGEYEFIVKADWKQTKDGNPYINFAFHIRKDVEQECGGRIIFDPLYRNKETGEFSPTRINGLLSAIPNVKTEFEDYDDFIQYINGQCMKARVGIRKANPEDTNSRDRNIIVFGSYRPSSIPLAEGTIAQPKSEEELLEELDF